MWQFGGIPAVELRRASCGMGEDYISARQLFGRPLPDRMPNRALFDEATWHMIKQRLRGAPMPPGRSSGLPDASRLARLGIRLPAAAGMSSATTCAHAAEGSSLAGA